MEHAPALLREALAAIAPGTELREGLARIQRGHTGALIVLGYNDDVEALCSDGFTLDDEFTATGLRELCKMDGAVVISSDYTRIRRANVQLIPDPSIPTVETGMRHRTADRVAHQSGLPVISVSASMSTITVYVGNIRHTITEPEMLLARGDQAINTLERYRARLSEHSLRLSEYETKDAVTVRDVAQVLQASEMVRRISSEVDDYLSELGTEGRLLALQLDDLVRGTGTLRTYVLADYHTPNIEIQAAEESLSSLTGAELVDLSRVAGVLGIVALEPSDLDTTLIPRGYRLLATIPRLSHTLLNAVVENWNCLSELRKATKEELLNIEGMTTYRAKLIRETLLQGRR